MNGAPISDETAVRKTSPRKTLHRYVNIISFANTFTRSGYVRPDPINVAVKDKLNDALRDTRWKRFLIN